MIDYKEPVAWIQADHLQKAKAAPFLCRVEPTQRLPDFVPLYAHPAAPAPDDARDAARYRWLRGGADVPTYSTRWGRWEINHWQGANGWRNLLCGELDAAIDEAMKEKA